MTKDLIRCSWCGVDPLYVAYHDNEWGTPIHDDSVLFEFLTLEWAQAGLSWITVLRKRENYRKYFYNWNIEKIAQMRDEELEKILLDPGVVRNRLKIYSVRKNAIVALQIQQEFWSLDNYLWNSGFCHREERSDPEKQKGIPDSDWIASFARNDRYRQIFPVINHPQSLSDFVSESEISKKISKDLKKRGMSFVGSTIIYAFMQAVGMVDDHIETCFRKNIVGREIKI